MTAADPCAPLFSASWAAAFLPGAEEPSMDPRDDPMYCTRCGTYIVPAHPAPFCQCDDLQFVAYDDRPSDDERIAVFLDGGMEDGERDAMLTHLAEHDEDRAVAVFAAARLRELEEDDAATAPTPAPAVAAYPLGPAGDLHAVLVGVMPKVMRLVQAQMYLYTRKQYASGRWRMEQHHELWGDFGITGKRRIRLDATIRRHFGFAAFDSARQGDETVGQLALSVARALVGDLLRIQLARARGERERQDGAR